MAERYVFYTLLEGNQALHVCLTYTLTYTLKTVVYIWFSTYTWVTKAVIHFVLYFAPKDQELRYNNSFSIVIISRGGLEVEQWSGNRTLSISVDQSPLWACMIIWYQWTRYVMYVLDVCYIQYSESCVQCTKIIN